MEKEKILKQEKRMATPMSKKVKQKKMLKNLPDSHDSISLSVLKKKDMMSVPLNFIVVRCGSSFSAALTGIFFALISLVTFPQRMESCICGVTIAVGSLGLAQPSTKKSQL